MLVQVVGDGDGLPIGNGLGNIYEITPLAPDTAKPTVTFEATNANTIEWTASEAIDEGTLAGISFFADSGSGPVALTPSNLTGIGTASGTIDIAENMLDTDDLTFDITGSDWEDAAGNVMDDDSGSVTNSIGAAGPVDFTYDFASGSATDDGGVWEQDYPGPPALGIVNNAVRPANTSYRISVEYQPDANDSPIGFDTGTSAAGGAQMDAAFNFNAGTIYKWSGGSPTAAGSATAGRRYGILIDGDTGATKMQESVDGVTYTDLASGSMGLVSTAQLNILTTWDGAPGKVYHPKGEVVV